MIAHACASGDVKWDAQGLLDTLYSKSAGMRPLGGLSGNDAAHAVPDAQLQIEHEVVAAMPFVDGLARSSCTCLTLEGRQGFRSLTVNTASKEQLLFLRGDASTNVCA